MTISFLANILMHNAIIKKTDDFGIVCITEFEM
jgi:hypothetical protein